MNYFVLWPSIYEVDMRGRGSGSGDRMRTGGD